MILLDTDQLAVFTECRNPGPKADLPFSFGGMLMPSVTLEDAQARLPQLLSELQPGEEMTITAHGQPLARVRKAERTSWACKAGCYRKAEFWMAPDFDAPLDEFKEYME
jgi:antitoxin (DNA-binding transcriptional repressor) of toxin-antitoxin stability system